MDFSKLVRSLPAVQDGQNTTEVPISLTQLPPNLLESLIPGYGIISQYAQAYLGFDISIFVTLGLLLVGLSKAAEYIYDEARTHFRSVFMSSVHIDEYDDLFDMVMSWLAEHQGSSAKRSVRAVTVRGSAVEDALDDSEDNALDVNGLFDYKKWSARTPPRYEPYYGRQMMWHNGTLFFFKRSPRSTQARVQLSWGGSTEDDILQIDCIGRSTEPTRDLLRSIRGWSLDRLRGTTTIRHPTPKDRARYGGSWSKTTARPSRPMDTIILDSIQKDAIIKDMNDYLHPASPKWYARRGIPYRRGYLFHGPPGTGKTSLSFALAGIFGLEIYAISLQEPTLTEGDLMMLFNGLSRRCIVLLEDIDAAGLLRDEKSDDAQKATAKKTKKKAKKTKDAASANAKPTKALTNGTTATNGKQETEYTLKDFARELTPLLAPIAKMATSSDSSSSTKNNNNTTTTSSSSTPDNTAADPNAAGPRRQRAPGTGISLSGLLNAIDGVATHEGRVLIMTTNHPEKLDAALVRPGRVDRRVQFALAKREQVLELFVRMYAASEGGIAANGVVVKAHVDRGVNGYANGNATGREKGVVKEKSRDAKFAGLDELAERFAAKIPDDTFTPAEIQNLLMLHRMEPWVAVEKAEEWVRSTLEEKEKQRLAKEGKDEEEESEDDSDDEDGDGDGVDAGSNGSSGSGGGSGSNSSNGSNDSIGTEGTDGGNNE